MPLDLDYWTPNEPPPRSSGVATDVFTYCSIISSLLSCIAIGLYFGNPGSALAGAIACGCLGGPLVALITIMGRIGLHMAKRPNWETRRFLAERSRNVTIACGIVHGIASVAVAVSIPMVASTMLWEWLRVTLGVTMILFPAILGRVSGMMVFRRI